LPQLDPVDLVLTDPPYGMDYQSDYRLDRDQDRKHDVINGDASTEDATQGITDCLAALHPKLKPDAHVFCFCHWSNEADIRASVEAAGYQIRGSLIWVKNHTGMGDPNTTFAPKHERIIHGVKGSPVLFSRAADVLLADRCNSERHPTEKPIALLKQLIEVTTTENEIVVDPFAGVASTLVAAKELKRAFFGCEINEGYYNKGSDRL
jgi:site-specific DNA-methyltransferase (adenine-specific)